MKNANKSKGTIVVYKKGIEVKLEQETVWLTQKQMADLFKTDRTVIGRHIRNIFSTKELEEKGNVQKLHIPFSDKPTSFYNLDIIISVGYRVNSSKATQFRIWATHILRKYLVNGYTLNEKRLKTAANKYRELQDSCDFKFIEFVGNGLKPFPTDRVQIHNA